MSAELPGDLTPVIVGYGRAGRELHHASLRRLAGGNPDVLAVDPVQPRWLLPGARWVASLEAAIDRLGDPSRAVFHVTTPVREHRPVVEALVAAGAKRIVVEKPIAGTLADARRIAMAADTSVQVLPVGVWLASRVTERVEKAVADGRVGAPVGLYMKQSKPRFRRSQGCRSHQSAIEVELPHQLLLALHLAGPITEVVHAAIWSMGLPDGQTLRGMGGVRVDLAHTNGMTSTLVSDLTAPMRLRQLRVTGTAGEILAHYPVSGDDDVGQLQLPGQRHRTLVRDAPLSQFLAAAYAHFAGRSDPPRGDLTLHLRVAELLEAVATQAMTTERQVLQSC
ncbi:MAG: Gfo/Idh/MocA family oxidoreductase [Egibacteraceae bacterium]